MTETNLRIYVPDGSAKKCGHTIPSGSEVKIIKFLPKRRAVVEWNGRRFLTLSLCCRKLVRK